MSTVELIPNSLNKKIWYKEIARPYLFEMDLREPFVCILFVSDNDISADERSSICGKLVNTKCKYAVCAGYKCSDWDDAIDWADLEKWDYDVPDDEHIMTTWHTDDTVEEVLHYGLFMTEFDERNFQKYVILQLGQNDVLKKEIFKSIAHLQSST